MPRISVNLSEVMELKQAIHHGESTSIAVFSDIKATVNRNSADLNLQIQQIQSVMNSCNAIYSRINKKRSDIYKEIREVEQELQNTPAKQKKPIEKNGEVEYKEVYNPRHSILQNKIYSLREELYRYDSMLAKCRYLLNDGSAQISVLRNAKKDLSDICEDLKKMTEKIATQCDYATQRLDSLANVIDSYLSLKIGFPLASISDSGVTASGGKISQAFKSAWKTSVSVGKKAVLLGKIFTTVTAPVSAVEANGMNGLKQNQEVQYSSMVSKQREQEREENNNLSILEAQKKYSTEPMKPNDSSMVYVDEKGTQTKYTVEFDLSNTENDHNHSDAKDTVDSVEKQVENSSALNDVSSKEWELENNKPYKERTQQNGLSPSDGKNVNKESKKSKVDKLLGISALAVASSQGPIFSPYGSDIVSQEHLQTHMVMSTENEVKKSEGTDIYDVILEAADGVSQVLEQKFEPLSSKHEKERLYELDQSKKVQQQHHEEKMQKYLEEEKRKNAEQQRETLARIMKSKGNKK